MRRKIICKRKKAVSLIVLVITIIVMILLAGAIVLTLNNSGIIEQAQSAVDETNLKEVQTLASLKWAEVYMDENIPQENLEQEVLNRLSEENIDLTPYVITVTTEGVKVSKNWLVATVDGVPIPKGFVASSATGENTKNGGLVIYEGTTPVTDSNVEDAKRTRNQYVWVPVDDFSKFVRQTFGISYTISNKLGTEYWEVVLDTTTNMPLSTQSTSYVTSTTLAEVQAMYESVKEYKGFYIARYEAGLNVGSHKTSDDGVIIKSIHLKMNKAPYNYVKWTYNNKMDEDTNGAVEVARSVYPVTNANYGVVSTLTYSVQWDRTLAWWVETKAQNGTKDVTITSNDNLNSSTQHGNYSDNEIAKESFNTGAQYLLYSNSSLATTYADVTTAKASSTEWLLTTGATEETRVNNIYDMAGNVEEWTMEGYSSDIRVIYGGSFYYNGSERHVSYRNFNGPHDAVCVYGFRPSLYIKK